MAIPSNSILTPTAVTREALRILHQKLNFVGNINRQYDDSFAKTGAKIGDSLKIRLPNQYVVRSGATLVPQDTVETSTTLQVATQKGVDLNFTGVDLTLSLDDFSKRILDPAMSVLAANVEADALSMVNDIYNNVDQDTKVMSLNTILMGRKVLSDNLCPMDNNRSALLSTTSSVYLVDALKGLFQDSSAIASQYREGKMGRTAGFDFYENTLLSAHTTGTAAKTTGYATSGAVTANGSTQVAIITGTTTFKKGDIVTFSTCLEVHPETKVPTGRLQQFVVTADIAAPGNLQFSPAIYTTTGRQNVTSVGIPTGALVVKVGAGASELYTPDVVFHKDAFTFATADLVMPQGVDFTAREVLDGLSMRIVRQYAIGDDTFPCRLDILYGYKTIRAQLACRLLADGVPA